MSEHPMITRYKGKNPLLETLKKLNRPPEDHAKASMEGYIMSDWLLFTSIQKETDTRKATELCDKAWTKLANELFLDAQTTLKIDKVSDIATLGKIAKFIYDLRSMPVKPEKEDEDTFIGIINICPFIHYSSELFNEKLDSDYWKSLTEIEKNQLKNLVDRARLSDVETHWEKQMCAGDNFCKFVFKRKR